MTDQYVAVTPGRTVRLDDEYEVRTELIDPADRFHYRQRGEGQWQVASFVRDHHLPTGWRPAGQRFEVSARWSDSPAVILVRRATRP